MQLTVTNSFLLALILGLQHADAQNKINKGYNAQKGEVPYIVSINKDGTHVCGGVILSERWIVTAAHCVKDSSEITVLAGVTDLENLEEDRQVGYVEKTVLHPQYQHGDHHNIENNIALIKLKKDLNFNKIVSKIDIMPGDDLQLAISSKAVGQIAGWGTEEDPHQHGDHHHGEEHHHHHSRYLKLVQITLLNHGECKADVNEKCHTYNQAANLCTGPLTGPKTGVTHFDDGGPLIINDKLAGVILHGEHEHPDEADCHKSSLYNNIEYYKNFIDETIKKS